MQVFNAYVKIIRACLPSLLVNLFIFLTISFIISKYNTNPVSTDFTETKTRITVIDRDGDSSLAEGLTDFLSEKNTIVSLPDDPEKLQDALFFRDVEYIAIIPTGFSRDFAAGADRQIETVIVPDSTTARYIDLQVNKYFQSMRLILTHSKLPAEKQSQLVSDSLAQKVDVKMTSKAGANQSEGYVYYFNYFAYAMLALSMLGTSTIMMVFNQPDLRRRNHCAPIKQHIMSLQLAFGSVIYSLVCWALLIFLGLLMYGQQLLSSGLLPILSLNALVFTFVCTAIGFLVGILIKSYNVQGAITNVITLGMCFLSGVFVPQELLGDSVLRFANFLPAYWYVRANSQIGSSNFEYDKILIPILIQVGFAIAIFSVGLFIAKQKRTANQ